MTSPCWGQLMPVCAQERDSAASTNPELRRLPRSLQTAWLSFLLLKQPLSRAGYPSAASPPSSSCPPPHPQCSLPRAPNLPPGHPLPGPHGPHQCPALPVSDGPNPTSCSSSWRRGQGMLISVLIITWARFLYSVKYTLPQTCLESEQSCCSYVQAKA